jgi:hypothetical protein
MEADMAAIAGGGTGGVLRTVVQRQQLPNYIRDTLSCGHTVADYDNRQPKQRRCVACLKTKETDMARIFSFRRPRASAIMPPAEPPDVGGAIPDDVRLAIKRCARRVGRQHYYDCLRDYLIWRGDLEIHDSPEHEYASDITGGDLA